MKDADKNEEYEQLDPIELDEINERDDEGEELNKLLHERDPEYVTIVCPKCKKKVDIGEDGICPECGCEFEENLKHFKLTKFAAFIAAMSAIFYGVLVIFLCYTELKPPGNAGDEYTLTVAEFLTNKMFTEMFAVSVIILLICIILVCIKSRIVKFILGLAILVFSVQGGYLFYLSQKESLFCPFMWLFICLPFIELFAGFLVLIDQFINIGARAA